MSEIYAPADLRRAARRRAHGRVFVAMAGYTPALTLIDVSDGGFAITSPSPFKVGTVRRFTFTTDTDPIALRARVAHCAKLFPSRFLSGWEFMFDTPAHLVHEIIAATT